MNFFTIKHLTIKSFVTLANLLTNITLLIVFLTFINKIKIISLPTMMKLAYFLIGFAFSFFVFYHIVRIVQIKKSPFQLLKRHKIYNQSFYWVEYLCFFTNLLIIILINTKVLMGNDVTIVFAVFCPVFLLAMMFASILESIVRVEERIFINQQQLNDQKDDLQQKDANQTIRSDINPFLPFSTDEDSKNNEKENN